jgi:hypothetical protein
MWIIHFKNLFKILYIIFCKKFLFNFTKEPDKFKIKLKNENNYLVKKLTT